MKYNFKCKKCNKVKTIDISMSEISNAEVTCDCGNKMIRIWSAALVVPDYMKANQTQEMSWVNDKLNTRPSGKTKVYY